MKELDWDQKRRTGTSQQRKKQILQASSFSQQQEPWNSSSSSCLVVLVLWVQGLRERYIWLQKMLNSDERGIVECSRGCWDAIKTTDYMFQSYCKWTHFCQCRGHPPSELTTLKTISYALLLSPPTIFIRTAPSSSLFFILFRFSSSSQRTAVPPS